MAVEYCYPSGLEKILCKWDIYVPLVTKELILGAGLWILFMCRCRNTITDPGIQTIHVRPTWLPTFSHFCHSHATFRNVTCLYRQTKYRCYEIYDILHVVWSHVYGVTTRWLPTPWRIAQNLPRRSKLSKHHKYHDTGVNVTSYRPIEK